MQIRQGFVSNSSSSSFLVGFKRKPKTPEELKQIMFPNDNGYIAYYDHSMSVHEIVQRVYNDLVSQIKPLTQSQIIEEINGGYYDGCPDFYSMSKPWRETSNRIADEFCELFNKTSSKKITTMYSEEAKDHPEYSKYYERCHKAIQEEYEEIRKVRKEYAVSYYNSIKNIFKGLKVYVFSYADDSGESLLEHGDIFMNVPHVRISHH